MKADKYEERQFNTNKLCPDMPQNDEKANIVVIMNLKPHILYWSYIFCAWDRNATLYDSSQTHLAGFDAVRR